MAELQLRFWAYALFYTPDNCTKKKNTTKVDFYIDDLMAGADLITEFKIIHHNIRNQLKTYGFILLKWLSNKKNIVEDVGDFAQNVLLLIKDDEAIKTLGLQWDQIKKKLQKDML